MLGPKRFTDLRTSLPGISANILTQRLEGLEAAGVLVRRRLAPPAAAWVYELTPWGYEAEPILQVLGRWAARSPLHDPTLPLSAVSLMMSFRTMFDAPRAGDLAARVGFRIGEESFVATIADGTLSVARIEPVAVDLMLEGPATAIAALVYAGQQLDDLVAAGALRFSGDRALAERFATLFPLPPKII